MILYHGGTAAVKDPVILDTQRLLDFGNAFYTTTNQQQSESWAKIKQKRRNTYTAIVSVYELDAELFLDQRLNIKIFNNANEEWLDFIVDNRKGSSNHSYDIVKGPVANDTLYSTLLLYENKILSKNETIIRLKTHELFDQISFHNKLVLGKLKFIESYSPQIS